MAVSNIERHPYLKNLYSPLIKFDGFKLVEYDNISGLFSIFFNNRIEILHLQWLHNYYTGEKWFQNFRGPFFVFFLILFKLLKVKIVSTPHNISPHKGGSLFDFLFHLIFFKLSSIVIAHTEWEKGELLKIYNIKPMKIRIIYHGNFTVNPSNNDIITLKKLYNISPNQTVFLFFGRILEYKGIRTLCKAIIKVLEKSNKCIFFIAGNVVEKDLGEVLKELKYSYPNYINLYLGFVPDEKLSEFYKISDWCVLPYNKITTSGVIFLCKGMKVPMILPDFVQLKEVISENEALFIKGLNANNLAELLLKISNEGYRLKNNKKYNSSWKESSKNLYYIYNEIISNI